jgi:hypothetical protein
MILLALACTTPATEAPPPDFDEAVHEAFRRFAEADTAPLAVDVLAMESAIDADLDLTAADTSLRAFTPSPLAVEDLAGVDVPDRDPGAAVASALARLSLFPRETHLPLPLLVDQTPLEPQCPEHYVRSFLAGEACWPDCELDTSNDLTKQNLLFKASYVLPKAYRPVELDDGRVATLARTWTTERVVAEDDAAVIEQSESLEFWLDRPDGSGALRMMAVWSETTFPAMDVDDATVALTLRVGTDEIFARQDDYLLAESGGE